MPTVRGLPTMPGYGHVPGGTTTVIVFDILVPLVSVPGELNSGVALITEQMGASINQRMNKLQETEKSSAKGEVL